MTYLLQLSYGYHLYMTRSFSTKEVMAMQKHTNL